VGYISNIRKLSLAIFIVPTIAINLCLFVVIYVDLEIGSNIGPSFPYIDGGTSISRTARVFPTYLIFKPAMFLTAYFLINYWISNYKLINSLEPNYNYKKYFRFFGIASAIFLILHSIFLGIKFDISIYKFFRRFVILSFVIFELVAQALLVINLNKIKNGIENLISLKVLKLKIILVTTLILVAIVSIPIISSSGFVKFKHALEWDFMMGVLTFYLLTFYFWKKPLPHTLSGV
tara:strand:- start:6 stop:707 length:702 start_codon:yes stop_codon:yes gene_type:complete